MTLSLRHLPADIAADVAVVALAQGDVLSRRQLYRLGVTRWMLAVNLRASRWRLHGRQTICLHTGELDDAGMRWHGVHEAGPRAAIDGVSSLQAAGLTGFASDHVRVSVPRGAPAVRRSGLMVRQTRRLQPGDVMPTGLPRVRTEIAAIRAALWARSDRQASLVLAMVVQQRLTTPQALGQTLLTIRRHRRRRMIESVILDLLDGAQAMGELDFARLCRRYGLPKPHRQSVRRTSQGTAYLDVEWPAFDLVVEIDGIHHLGADAVVADALRQNSVSLGGSRVLRLPLLGLRVAEGEFIEQIREGLREGGWRQAA